MKRRICALVLMIAVAPLLAPARASEDDPMAAVLKRSGYTVSLDLKISKKKQGALRRAFSTIVDNGPNAHATGFVVGEGLVMTAYHAVSGGLGAQKKMQLGFAPDDELEATAYVRGCEATVVKVDISADLALLRVCQTPKRPLAPAFQASPVPEDKIVLIARQSGGKTVRRGTISGAYTLRGQQYWAAKIEGRDGYSGSPVYNAKAEIVGVFSGYDWSKNIALISPADRAQKLLEEYANDHKP